MRGSAWGDWRLLAWLRAAAASNSSSAALLQLRQAIGGAPGHEPEGKRARVREANQGKRLRPERREGDGQHGLAVVVAYLGHGGLEEGTAALGLAALAWAS